MFNAYELFGFMPPALATEIIEPDLCHQQGLYHATLAAVGRGAPAAPGLLRAQAAAPNANKDND